MRGFFGFYHLIYLLVTFLEFSCPGHKYWDSKSMPLCCRSRWGDLGGPGGLAGARLSDPRLVVKTVVELAFRSARRSGIGEGGAALGAVADRYPQKERADRERAKARPHPAAATEADRKAEGDAAAAAWPALSGGEANHAAVAECVAAVLEALSRQHDGGNDVEGEGSVGHDEGPSGRSKAAALRTSAFALRVLLHPTAPEQCRKGLRI